MKPSNLDHIVLTVKNIETSVAFYETVMGMKREVFGEGRISLKFGNQKINLHQYGKDFETKATQPAPGSADLCFLTETPLEEAMTHVSESGIQILEGPIKRTVATLQSFRSISGIQMETSSKLPILKNRLKVVNSGGPFLHE